MIINDYFLSKMIEFHTFEMQRQYEGECRPLSNQARLLKMRAEAGICCYLSNF
jgi:hypothetical protein